MNREKKHNASFFLKYINKIIINKMARLVKESLSLFLNENTTERFKFNAVPHEKIEKSKEWIRNNPDIARGKPEDNDLIEIEVFGYNNHKEVASELYKALKNSGFFDKYPLFRIKVDSM
jgi:hypothetical protein